MDRRVLWAVVLMMVIAIVPSFYFKPAPRPRPAAVVPDSAAQAAAPAAAPGTVGAAPAPAGLPAAPAADSGVPAKEDTIVVRSPLYAYAFGSHGGRLVSATLPKYVSHAEATQGQPVQLVRPGQPILTGLLVSGRDTIDLATIAMRPSVPFLEMKDRPEALTFAGTRNGLSVELTYTFRPDDYRFDVSGTATGVGPNGGLLLLSLGNGIAESERDTNDNHHAAALVTKVVGSDADRNDFAKLDPGITKTYSGPFDWTAVKSKYFVAALLSADSSGRLSGATATTSPTAGKRPAHADVRVSLPVPASGRFGFTVYAGPLEYRRLNAIGHDFDDVNPYGWPGFRTLIRFFSAPVRWLLLFMHEHLGLAYGIALIAFGILIRVVLWPLNQKAMRSSAQMQALQPKLQAIQAKYKNDPVKAQQAQAQLFKESGVNPLGGCWPMLLPYPVMIALWFVFQYTIELRGVPFAWLPDLSRPDPYYVIPVLMGASMYAVSKIGQIGMEQNPQMKMMLYLMPVMLTAMFLSLPSGLNLYYLVSNLASVPQQWLISRDRLRNQNAAVVVGTKQ